MTVTADTDLALAGVGALAAMVRAGEVHPRELVELYLRRIERLDAPINAFRAVRAERALAESEEVDRNGPLAGVPIAVKDDLAVAGEVATRGTLVHGPPATADAEPIRRLRAAGAIPVGITRVPELMVFPWTVSRAGGVTRNPWNLFRTPGGSSGGSAAAVAAGLCAAATGSDGGGSIRIPAACCGLVGMKPSRGRVSAQPRGEVWLGLGVYGPLARTVSDSALMLDAMRGTLGAEASPLPEFTGSYAASAAADPGRLRIAISRRVPPGVLARVSSEQRDAWERTAGLLEGLGHDVQEAHPAYRGAELEFLQYWLRGVYEDSLGVPDAAALEPATRQMASAGRYLVPPYRRAALLARRPRTSARILALWERFDVLLTPGLAKTAMGAEGAFGRSAPVAIDVSGRFTPFTAVFNMTGQPAVSLPAGIGADGLPLSVQLVGRPGGEDLLYSLAGQIERAAPWSGLRPHEP